MSLLVVYVLISYYVAYVSKVAGIRKKWLPVISASAGLVCGLVGFFIGLHGEDIFDAIALGLFSGFSAVGTNEIAKYVFVRKE